MNVLVGQCTVVREGSVNKFSFRTQAHTPLRASRLCMTCEMTSYSDRSKVNENSIRESIIYVAMPEQRHDFASTNKNPATSQNKINCSWKPKFRGTCSSLPRFGICRDRTWRKYR